MKITPLDIRQKQFKSAMRGLDAREVEAYLELLASEFEEVVKENIELKEELKRRQQKIDDYREREKTLQETMITAQRISEDMKAAARKEAEIILSDAELQAEKILHNANRKLVQIVDDISEMKRQRVQFESEVRGIIEGHLKLLDTFKTTRGSVKVEENVAFLAAKKTAD